MLLARSPTGGSALCIVGRHARPHHALCRKLRKPPETSRAVHLSRETANRRTARVVVPSEIRPSAARRPISLLRKHQNLCETVLVGGVGAGLGGRRRMRNGGRDLAGRTAALAGEPVLEAIEVQVD